jgi:hypothetical protein
MYCSGRSAAALYCILCFEASVVAISVFIGSVSERIRWTSVQLEKLSSFIPSSQYLKNQYVLEDSVNYHISGLGASRISRAGECQCRTYYKSETAADYGGP